MITHLLTVAICAYNAQDTLPDTLRSLYLQTSHDFDVHIIQDGPCPEQDAIVQDAMDTAPDDLFIYTTHFRENQGIGAARNLALQSLVTPYITFLDADDLLMPHAVETILEACKADADVIIGKTMREGPDGRFEIVGIESSTWLHGRAYKQSFLEQYGIIFPNIRMSEDLGFNACVEEFVDRNKIAQTYTPIHIQRWREGSLSRQSGVSGFHSSSTYMDALRHYIACLARNRVPYERAKVLPGFLAGAYYRMTNETDAERREHLDGLLSAVCSEVNPQWLIANYPDFAWKLATEMAKGFLAYATTPDTMLRLWSAEI